MADTDDERGVPIPIKAAPPTDMTQVVLVPKAAKKRKLKRKKVKKMVDTVMMPDNSGMGGAGLGLGAGLGGGLLGGILASALFGRGNLLGNGVGVDGAVGVRNGAWGDPGNTAVTTPMILQTLGDIKAAIPLAESQVQLALAGQTANLTANINNANVANLQGQAQLERALSQQSQGLERALNGQSQLLQSAVAGVAVQADRNLYQLSTAITADGAQTRALIIAQNDAMLNRIITTQAAELTELRNENHRSNDRHGIEITMINNQNQNQMQFQQQQQLMGGLAHLLNDVSQVARATNSNVIVGNAGATTTGAQTASPVNVVAP